MNLYHFLRKVIRLPRPNEVFGEGIENKWDIFTLALYFRFTTGTTLGWVGTFMGLINFVLLMSIKFGFTGLGEIIGAVFLGAFLMALIGHILIAIGIVKKENAMAQNQNDQIKELIDNTRELLKK